MSDTVKSEEGASGFDSELSRIDEMLDQEKYYEAFDAVGGLSGLAESQLELVKSFMIKAMYFDLIGSRRLELALYDDAYSRFSDSKNEDILWHLAWMMFNRGVIETEADENEQAIKSYELAIAVANKAGDDAKTAALNSLYNLASARIKAGDREQGMDTYRKIAHAYSPSDDLDALEQVARARASLANGYMASEQYGDADAIYNDLFAMSEEALALMPRVLRERSRVMHASAKLELNPTGSGLRPLKAIFEELKSSHSSDLREVAAFALFNKARFEMKLDLFAEARDDYALLLEEFGGEGGRTVNLIDGARAGLKEAKLMLDVERQDRKSAVGKSPTKSSEASI